MPQFKISTRQLEIGITKGKTIEDFSKQLGISEQEFSDFIRRNFYEEKQKDYFGRLERNRKNKLRKGGRHNMAKADKGVAAEEVLEPEPDQKELISSEIETLRDELNSVEIHHKKLCSVRYEIRKTLVCYQGKLQEMLEAVKSFQQEVERLEGEINRTSNEMVEANLKIDELREQLSKKEAELEELQRKTILVLDSGELEDEDGNAIEVSGWEDLRNHLRTEVTLEDFTGKQLKAMAKAIKLNGTEINVEYVFESDELETAYKTYESR